jgi:hypothetical protein
LAYTLNRWEREGKRRKAACWAALSDRISLAVEVLINSIGKMGPHFTYPLHRINHLNTSADDQDKLAAGILIILNSSEGEFSTRSPQIKEQYTRLIPKLNDSYLRAMLYHTALEDWSEVLAEDIPIPEKLSIALRFLSDEDVSKYLRSLVEDCRRTGDLLGLMITGLTPMGLSLIQGYVDLTGDVQTATLISGLVSPGKYTDQRARRWLDSYRHLLVNWRLYGHRGILDILHPRHSKQDSSTGSQEGGLCLTLRCNFCGKMSKAMMHSTIPSALPGRVSACTIYAWKPFITKAECLLHALPPKFTTLRHLLTSYRNSREEFVYKLEFIFKWCLNPYINCFETGD